MSAVGNKLLEAPQIAVADAELLQLGDCMKQIARADLLFYLSHRLGAATAAHQASPNSTSQLSLGRDRSRYRVLDLGSGSRVVSLLLLELLMHSLGTVRANERIRHEKSIDPSYD